jgi:hypothetical protein
MAPPNKKPTARNGCEAAGMSSSTDISITGAQALATLLVQICTDAYAPGASLAEVAL